MVTVSEIYKNVYTVETLDLRMHFDKTIFTCAFFKVFKWLNTY